MASSGSIVCQDDDTERFQISDHASVPRTTAAQAQSQPSAGGRAGNGGRSQDGNKRAEDLMEEEINAAVAEENEAVAEEKEKEEAVEKEKHEEERAGDEGDDGSFTSEDAEALLYAEIRKTALRGDGEAAVASKEKIEQHVEAGKEVERGREERGKSVKEKKKEDGRGAMVEEVEENVAHPVKYVNVEEEEKEEEEEEDIFAPVRPVLLQQPHPQLQQQQSQLQQKQPQCQLQQQQSQLQQQPYCHPHPHQHPLPTLSNSPSCVVRLEEGVPCGKLYPDLRPVFIRKLWGRANTLRYD